MEAGVDEVVCRGKVVFAITSVDKREVLQVSIIIQGEIVEHDDTEEFQDFNGSRFNVFTNDVGAFLIT